MTAAALRLAGIAAAVAALSACSLTARSDAPRTGGGDEPIVTNSDQTWRGDRGPDGLILRPSPSVKVEEEALPEPGAR